MMKLFSLLFSLILLLTSPLLPAQTFTMADTEETGYDMNPEMTRYSAVSMPDNSYWFVGMKEKVASYVNMMGSQFLIHYNENGERIDYLMIDGALIIHKVVSDPGGALYLMGDYYFEDVVFWDQTTLTWDGANLQSFVARVTPGGLVDWVVNTQELFGQFTTATALAWYGDKGYLAWGDWASSGISSFDSTGSFTTVIEQQHVRLISSLDIDSQGRIYVTGSCAESNAMFNGVSFPTSLTYNKYMVSYDTDFHPRWVNYVDDITCVEPRIAVSPADELYWSGDLYIETLFDTITLNGPVWSSDFFLCRYNTDGQIQWAREVPEVMTGQAGTGLSRHLEVMQDGSVVLAGYTSGTLDWGNGVTTEVPAGDGNQLMMLCYDTDGNPRWARTSTGSQWGKAQMITGTTNGKLLIAGVSSGDTHFDEFTLSPATFYYPVIAQLDPSLITTTTEESFPERALVLYPVPATQQIHIKGVHAVEAKLFDLQGHQMACNLNLATQTIGLNHLPEGWYVADIRDASGTHHRSKVIVR